MEMLALLGGLAIGGLVGWLIATARIRASLELSLREAAAHAAGAIAEAGALRAELETRKHDADLLAASLRIAESAKAASDARASEMQKRFEEQRRLVEDAERQLADTFKALATDILRNNSESFLTLATERFDSVQKQSAFDLDARHKAIDAIMGPARDSLARLDGEIRKIENERRGATEVLTDQLKSLSSQTNRLVDALKTPTVRGRWGEIQLRRVVEIAGMVERCDFDEQKGVSTEDGRLRPDMTIRLPAEKRIVVDAKVPLQAYMEALDASDDAERNAKLHDHARQIRNHVEQLSSKTYWDAFDCTPEFVVLFLPGEMFFSAALQQDPALIEYAANLRVILATPTTLIALLKAVAYGWRQEQLAENAEQISELGRQVHERLGIMTGHLVALGRELRKAVESFNRTVGSFESGVLPNARRFRELGVAGKQEIKQVEPIDTLPRLIEPAEVLEDDARASRNGESQEVARNGK
jgi:DNA recombination protein RmuC